MSAPVVEMWFQTKEFIAAVAGAALAFFLVMIYDYFRTRRRRRSHFAALKAELDFCRELAHAYQRDNVAAPLYRLPTMAYAHSLPALLSEAALSKGEVMHILTFFNEVETLNRGLDQADSALLLPDEQARNDLLVGVVARNRMKAERLSPLPPTAPGYYERADAVLSSRLKWYQP